MDYADHSLEHLLNQYHTETDLKELPKIEEVIKGRPLDIDEMATINNAFYYYVRTQRRADLRNWVLYVLKESAITTETYDLLKLYEQIGGAGVIAYFINLHLRERLVTSELWFTIIQKFEHLSLPLTAYAAQFILQHSNNPFMLADVHFYTGIRGNLRVRLTKKILAMQGQFSYLDWEEIATRCAHPSTLWHYASNELDEFYYADEEDLPRYPKKKKK